MLSRRWIVRLSNLRLVRSVAMWNSDRAYRRWRKRHPGAGFEAYYAYQNEQKIARGRAHPTLGTRGWAPGRGRAVAWTPDSAKRRGIDNWEQIRSFGLKPSMRCLDYGCGSLRLGIHAIDYLDPGHYWGLDPSAAFIRSGLELIDPETLAIKQPHTEVLNEAGLAAARAWGPEFIFSNAVLQHVPPEELEGFFSKLGSLLGPTTRAFVTCVTADEVVRIKAMNWSYPRSAIEAAVAAANPRLELEWMELEAAYAKLFGADRSILRLTMMSEEKSGVDGQADEAQGRERK